MIQTTQVSNQLWLVRDFFSTEQFNQIKQQYRQTRQEFTMQYDHRLLTPWSNSPDIQALCQEQTERISDIVKQSLLPQVGYISIDLAGSWIMMHRLHTDIKVQVQIPMCEQADTNMDFAFCNDAEVNSADSLDYQPVRRILPTMVDIAPYEPNVAGVYLSRPRSFVGMLGRVPNNSVREILVLSYTEKQY
jgi:hypothetical protein